MCERGIQQNSQLMGYAGVKINLQSVPGRLPEEVEALVNAETSKINVPELLKG